MQKLGFRGGLLRIRDVWEKYQFKQNGEISKNQFQVRFDELPSEIYDATENLIAQQKDQLEKIVVCTFQRCQSLFDKRLSDHTSKYDQQMVFYREYEASADASINKLEADIKDMQSEMKELAEQNAQLLIENAKLVGQVVAFDKTLQKVSSSKLE